MKPAADGALALALRRACGQQKIMQRGRPVRVGRPSLPQVLQLLALKWKGHQHSAGLALARRMGPHATGVFAPQPLILPFECGLVCRAPRARRSFLASQACSELSPFSGSWARSEAACNRTCAKKEPERAPPPQWQLQPDTRFRHAQRVNLHARAAAGGSARKAAGIKKFIMPSNSTAVQRFGYPADGSSSRSTQGPSR